MRISELSDRSGVPVATVKYYLREGLLPAGEALNAREASYGETHLERLRLIRGLVHVLGASISQVKQVLALLDSPNHTPWVAMGEATAALPAIRDAEEGAEQEPLFAIDFLSDLGFRFDPSTPAVRQLDTALRLADSLGIATDEEQMIAYGQAARQIAQADFARIPWEDPKAATTFAVLGTAVYEPVLLALRRLAHYELGAERFAASLVEGPTEARYAVRDEPDSGTLNGWGELNPF